MRWLLRFHGSTAVPSIAQVQLIACQDDTRRNWSQSVTQLQCLCAVPWRKPKPESDNRGAGDQEIETDLNSEKQAERRKQESKLALFQNLLIVWIPGSCLTPRSRLTQGITSQSFVRGGNANPPSSLASEVRGQPQWVKLSLFSCCYYWFWCLLNSMKTSKVEWRSSSFNMLLNSNSSLRLTQRR